MMDNYAVYRLPHQKHYMLLSQTDGGLQRVDSVADLNGCRGFVMAPFMQTEECPIVVIRPDVMEEVALPAAASPHCHAEPVGSDNLNSYRNDFLLFHEALAAGRFKKLVLARRCDFRHAETDPMALFVQACSLYPRLFIALVSTPLTGTWLFATPEILLEGEGNVWRTMALAGTMKLEAQDLKGEGESSRWSPKNIQEQRYVANYITGCLQKFASDFTEEGPSTVRAADLVHLRSDFTFQLKDDNHLGAMLEALHPTPAVCGLPKKEARDFILLHEHSTRKYYSGFMGPLFPGGQTHLYVSLRCMQLTDQMFHLYAGGGILKDSDVDSEWMETEAKLQTMRNVFK